MLKLIKYEAKATWKLVGTVLAIFVFMAASLRASVYAMPAMEGWKIFCGIILLLAFTVASVVLYGYFINRFRVTVFGKEGYITNTLPVYARQIIISKWLVAVFQSVIALGVMVLTLILFEYPIGNIIDGIFITETDTALSVIIAVIKMLTTTVSFYITVFAVMAVGHSFGSSKILISVGVYFAFKYVCDFAETLFIYLGVMTIFNMLQKGGSLSIPVMYTGYIIMDIICTAAAYFMAQYFIKNKLSLE